MYIKKQYLISLIRKKNKEIPKLKNHLYLNRNERAIPFDKKFLNKLYNRIKNINLSMYPQIDFLYKKIANWLNIPKNQIFLTEGVSGAIKSIIETLTLPSKSNIIFPEPGFSLYPVYAKMFNVEARILTYNNQNKLNLDQVKKLIDKNTSIIFLPNPNLPIDEFFNKVDIIKLLNLCKKNKIFLVLDEVYFPFSPISHISLIKKYDNLLIMRSFSKAFGLAGIRLGYIIGNKKNINYISKIRTGYETNVLSAEIASFFIDNYRDILNYVENVRVGLLFLKNKLNKNNISTIGEGNSCYLFVKVKSTRMANNITKDLYKKRIYVRNNWPKPYDKGFLVSGAPKNKINFFLKNFLHIYKKYNN